MNDAEFLANEQRYYARMERFILVHRGQPGGEILIELERRECWPKIMGAAAAALEPPALDMIEDAARRRGLAI